MALFTLTATLTTAGQNLINNAASSNSKISISTMRFGKATANPTAASTGVGTVTEETLFCIAGANLTNTRAEFYGSFVGETAATPGTIGVYVGNTLLCLAKFTMPVSSSRQARHQVTLRFDSPNASVFSNTKKTMVSVSQVSEMWKEGYADVLAYFGGTVPRNRASVFGAGAGNTNAAFVNHLHIVETESEAIAHQLSNSHDGGYYYDLRTWMRWEWNGSTWVQTTKSLNDLIIVGTFFYGAETRKLFYARGRNDLLKVIDPLQVLWMRTVISGTPAAAGNYYYYTHINSMSVPVAAGDKLLYDVLGQNPAIRAGVDCYVSGLAVPMRSLALPDQNGISCHPQSDITSRALNQWHSRSIDLSSLAGRTLSSWAIGDEAEIDAPESNVFFRNIRVVNSAGVVKAAIFTNDLKDPLSATPWVHGNGTQGARVPTVKVQAQSRFISTIV